MPVLFILDDDASLLLALQYWFQTKGYEVHVFISSLKLLDALKKRKPDFILIDVYLTRGEHGGELCFYLKKQLRLSCPIYLFSSSPLSYSRFCEYKADGFLLKRASFTELTKIVSSCILNKNNDEGVMADASVDGNNKSEYYV